MSKQDTRRYWRATFSKFNEDVERENELNKRFHDGVFIGGLVVLVIMLMIMAVQNTNHPPEITTICAGVLLG